MFVVYTVMAVVHMIYTMLINPEPKGQGVYQRQTSDD